MKQGERFHEELARILRGRVVFLCVGNELRGDDAAGLLLARNLRRRGLGELVIEAGPAPEAYLSKAAERADTVIIVDAVHAGLRPGDVILCSADSLPENARPVSTHDLPLPLLVRLLKALRPGLRVYLLGIQVGSLELGAPPSEDVVKAAETLADVICRLLAGARAEEGGSCSGARRSP